MDLSFYKRKTYELAFITPKQGTKITDGQWDVKLVSNPLQGSKWFADPFILDYNDQEIYLLVEEMDYKIKRGRIAKLTINRKTCSITDVKILLDLNTHLSFPAIYRKDNKIYIYPENSASGALQMYEYNINTDELTLIGTLIDEMVTDAIFRTYGGGKYLISTKLPSPNGDFLYIYQEINGEYQLAQNIQFDDQTARGAGDWFEEDARIIRPAQNCNGYYGVGLVFQEVNFENGEFTFREINRIKHPIGYDGMHTFNKYKDLCVIDYRRPIYPYVYYPCKFLYDMIIMCKKFVMAKVCLK